MGSPEAGLDWHDVPWILPQATTPKPPRGLRASPPQYRVRVGWRARYCLTWVVSLPVTVKPLPPVFLGGSGGAGGGAGLFSTIVAADFGGVEGGLATAALGSAGAGGATAGVGSAGAGFVTAGVGSGGADAETAGLRSSGVGSAARSGFSLSFCRRASSNTSTAFSVGSGNEGPGGADLATGAAEPSMAGGDGGTCEASAGVTAP